MNSHLSFWLIAALMFLPGCRADTSSKREPEHEKISNLRSKISDSNQQPPISGEYEIININTASAEKLQRLPHVGASMAEVIVEHRKKYGPFKRPEDLMLIRGISDARFRRIRHLIKVE